MCLGVEGTPHIRNEVARRVGECGGGREGARRKMDANEMGDKRIADRPRKRQHLALSVFVQSGQI